MDVLWVHELTPLHNGAELCRILTHPDPNATVHMEGKTEFPNGFGAPVHATVHDLRWLIASVRDIIGRFPLTLRHRPSPEPNA
jgi:hypothetical protein